MRFSMSVLLLSFLTASASAARVRKINKSSGQVLLDSGVEDGFEEDEKVCFYREKKRVACGKVTKSGEGKSVVKVKKSWVRRIRKGFRARRADASPDLKAPAYDYAIRALWLPYFLPETPANYNLLSYAGSSSATGESLWAIDGPYSSGVNSAILLSLGGEMDIARWNLRLGGHFKSYSPFLSEADYDTPGSSLFVSTNISASAVGAYAEMYFNIFHGLNLGLGLDLDMITLDLIGTRKDDTGGSSDEDLYILRASTTILSLKIPVRYDLYFKPFGLTAGANFYLPLTALATTVTQDNLDPVNGSKLQDINEDLAAQLNLTQNSFAFELLLGCFWGF